MANRTSISPGPSSNRARDHRLCPSGFDFLDRDTGGLRPSKRYLFLIAQGTERHVAVLQLVRAGLENGEVVLLLSAEDPEAVLLQGERLDLSLVRFLHGDQLMVLGYDAKFADLVSTPAAQDRLLADLQRKTNNRPINRVLFLDDPTGLGVNVKVRQAVDRLESFFHGEHRAVIVHVLSDADPEEPRTRELTQSAFGVFEVDAARAGGEYRGSFRVVKGPTFTEGAVTYGVGIFPGRGFVEVEGGDRIPVLYFSNDAAYRAELSSSLGTQFQVEGFGLEDDLPTAIGEAKRPPIVVVEIPPDDAGGRRALRVVEDVRRMTTAPVIVVSRAAGRTADRVTLLRHGADDVLQGGTSVTEVRERIRRHAVRQRLLPPIAPHDLRLETGADMTRANEDGTVPWGMFKEHLDRTLHAMSNIGGHLGFLGITIKDVDPGGAPAATAGVMRRLTQELVGLLRDQDFCTLSPDGMLVVRLNAAGVPEVDAAINRILPAITHKRVIDGAKVEIALATSVYPRDGTNADELTQFLRRPERKRVVQVAETEHTQRVDRGRLDR